MLRLYPNTSHFLLSLRGCVTTQP